MKPSPYKQVASEILLISLGVFGVLFFSILSSGYFHNLFYTLDLSFAQSLSSVQQYQVAEVFLFFTYLGNWEIIFTIELCLLIFLFLIRRRQDILLFMVSIFTGQILSMVFKIIAARDRPEGGLLIRAGNDSFPSGHALIAMLFYGLCGYLLIRAARSKAERWIVAVVVAMIIFLIGFSRLYLGVHWLSDVIAGWALGAILLSLFIILFEKMGRAHRTAKDPAHSRHEQKRAIFLRGLLIVLVLAEVFFIAYFYLSNPLPNLP